MVAIQAQLPLSLEIMVYSFYFMSFPENSLHQVELALTGSGLPVMLTFSPGPAINFMECCVGEHTDIICTLKNECDILPVSFAFRKIAHYNICPEKGKVKAKSSQVMYLFKNVYLSLI